jgi:predicted outer membrane repeat protein
MKIECLKLPSCVRSGCSKLLSLTLVTLLSLLPIVSAAASLKPRAGAPLAQTAASIEVNSTGDGDNLNPAVGCDTDAAAPGEQCTLRAAIQRANALSGDDEITFNIPATQPNCDATGVCNIKLTKALPEVSANLRITGPGANKLSVRRETGGNYRIFNFAAGVDAATISGLSISNGFAPEAGGAVLFLGKTLNVNGCVFSENRATEAGGAIHAEGSLNVSDSTFSGNLAPSVRGGGAIHALGALSVARSKFTDNTSGFRGGAISTGSGTPVEIRIADSTFERNGADTGGALGLYSIGSVTHITNCILRGNTTTGYSGGIYQSFGTLNLTNTTISDNQGFGLVILPSNGLVTNTNINNSTISGNARGGITTAITATLRTNLNVTNSTIAENKEGPGITIANRVTLNITNSTIARNEEGGVLRIETATDPGTWTVKSSIIASNRLDDVRGGFTSGGFNLIGKTDNSTGFTQPTDQTGTSASPLDPKLAPAGLQSNGGPTQTIALDPGSPALDKGTSDSLNGPLTTDQRGTGFARLYDNPAIANAAGGTDIGAFERNTADPIPPTVLQLSATTYSVNENTGPATIAVTRTGDNAGAVSVKYATSATTATGGTVDYTDVSGTLDWAAGDSAPKTITVPITNDASDEDNETISIKLSDPQGGATLGTQTQAVLTIIDEDAVPLLSVGFASVNEGNSGTTNMVVPITLSVASGKVVTVRAGTIAGGTATPGTDYVPIDNVLVTFNPGQTQASVTVQVTGDTEVEPDETILVKITNGTNAQVAGFQVAARIRNDDADQPASELKFNAATYTVNENDGTATITVTRTGSTTGVATVRYTIGNGTATSGSDYTNTFGELSFEDGQTTKSFTIPVINDSAKEPDETIVVTLSSPSAGVALGTPSMAVLTLVDDDPQPGVAIEDVTVTEGEAGTVEARFAVKLSAPTFQTVTVSYATVDATAQAGTDYDAASGFVTFNPGETSKNISVAVKADKFVEANETFNVNLSSPQNATLGDGQATATILNDDASVLQFSSNAYSVSEGAGHLDVTVSRTGDTSAAANVDYQTSDQSDTTPCQTLNTGFASVRCDYATAAGAIQFAPGESQRVIRLLLINDAYVEGPEQLSIKLGSPQGVDLGSTDTATITITDDDTQAAAQNPIDGLDFFIRQQYIDFLGRESDPDGFQFWKQRMTDNCPAGQTCDRTDTAFRFFQSDEFRERGYFAYLFYHASLGRRPTYGEWIKDVSKLNGTKTVAEQEAAKSTFIQDFINRQEFMNSYNSFQTGQTFVDALIQQSGVTPAARQQLIDNYGAVGRGGTLRAFIETPEAQATFFDRAFVSMLYFGFLRRDAEPGGFDFWLQKLNGTNHDHTFLIGGFLQSDEYRFRFALISNP